MRNGMMMYFLIAMFLVVIGLVIYQTITGKKASAKEKEKRYQVVRDKIKKFIFDSELRKNIRIEFDQVSARRGVEYKYRDVFDVIVQLVEPKTGKVLEVRAYEVEGITKKIDKKNYNTEWIVNDILDLESTQRRIKINEKKIKLTNAERKEFRKAEKEKELEILKLEKSKKQNKKSEEIDTSLLKSGNKFIPTRVKK